ncbi:MAG: ATP-binding protein [Candidatus Parabeggiatoa sp. nov. 3]|nr:MAG: ATP-binding protein [Gammaproteobacteria bacterium]
MTMKELLYQYNPWWEEAFKNENVKPREKYLIELRKYLDFKQIIILTGLRRVGKTTLMKLIIEEQINDGIEPNHILYVSLDDYLLHKNNIIEIVNEFRQIHKIKIEEKIYLFLDEITYKEDFHVQLKNIYDSQNTKLFVASSSASMLRDKKASLTGRAITIEIKPLDLEEYLYFNGITIKKRDKQLYKTHFLEYCKVGGLPENVLNPNREYLMNLVDDIIQKDITAFHAIKNHQIVRDYFTLLMERSGKQLSINKIGKILGISPDTSKRYLGFFESTYLIHLLPRWGKTNQQLLSAKKIYTSDLGIKHMFMGKRDLGSYFENYIYLLLRSRKTLYYLYENTTEIDFITEDKILIESKFYAKLNKKQEKLFNEYPANKKLIIDSVEKLQSLSEI